MAVTYATSLKTTRMQAVADAIDAAAGAGYIEIGTAAMASVLATVTLDATCGTVSGDTLTFTLPKTDSSADNTGTAAAARIKDGDGNVVVDGLTVGTSGTNIVLTSVAITAGDAVTLSSGALTHG